MKVGIPKEIYPHERRVAATPDTVREDGQARPRGRGRGGRRRRAVVRRRGLRRGGRADRADARGVYAEADIVLKVRQPIARPGGGHEADLLKPGAILISFIWPAQNKRAARPAGGAQGDGARDGRVPRITRAQKLDALSSMANIAGYRAVDRGGAPLRPLLHRADDGGRAVQPAKVLVIGAGVAGLAAIGAARGPGRGRARVRHAARSCASRSRAWAASSSRSSSRRRARARAATRRR